MSQRRRDATSRAGKVGFEDGRRAADELGAGLSARPPRPRPAATSRTQPRLEARCGSSVPAADSSTMNTDRCSALEEDIGDPEALELVVAEHRRALRRDRRGRRQRRRRLARETSPPTSTRRRFERTIEINLTGVGMARLVARVPGRHVIDQPAATCSMVSMRCPRSRTRPWKVSWNRTRAAKGPGGGRRRSSNPLRIEVTPPIRKSTNVGDADFSAAGSRPHGRRRRRRYVPRRARAARRSMRARSRSRASAPTRSPSADDRLRAVEHEQRDRRAAGGDEE